MATKKTDNTPQNVLKQTTQMRMWVTIGGVSAWLQWYVRFYLLAILNLSTSVRLH